MSGNGVKAGLVVSALILFCVLGYVGLYAYSMSKVEVRQVQVTGVREVSLEGAELGGIIELYNGGLVSVSVESVDYRLILEHDGSELVGGAVTGGAIPAKHAVNYSFSTRINWKPTAELALQLLTSERTYARLEGTVRLRRFWFMDVSIPFEKRISLENYINQFIKQEAVKYLPEDIISEAGRLLEDARRYL